MQGWKKILYCLLFLAGFPVLSGQDFTTVRVAEGFDFPVGKPDAEGYYKSRGFLSYHPGEDWNGLEGGNKDLGAPVYSIGNGFVTFAQDARMGWGNVVIVRHAYVEAGGLAVVDSMYAHLHEIKVRKGQQVVRGQLVGTIGTNRGMYVAHLHLEIRKNLFIGINRSAFPKNFQNYHRPSQFIAQRRKLPGAGQTAKIPINTYKTDQPGFDFSKHPDCEPANKNRSGSGNFRVRRFDDIGY